VLRVDSGVGGKFPAPLRLWSLGDWRGDFRLAATYLTASLTAKRLGMLNLH